MKQRRILSKDETPRILSEINITPLMDLTFLLLIVFIITFPFVEKGIPVNLPKGKGNNIERKTGVTVTVDQSGKVYFDNISVDYNELDRRISKMVEDFPDTVVYVRADEKVIYSYVVEVLNVARQAGARSISLVTKETNTKKGKQ